MIFKYFKSGYKNDSPKAEKRRAYFPLASYPAAILQFGWDKNSALDVHHLGLNTDPKGLQVGICIKICPTDLVDASWREGTGRKRCRDSRTGRRPNHSAGKPSERHGERKRTKIHQLWVYQVAISNCFILKPWMILF